MPLTWLQFELGGVGTPIEDWMRKIQSFLREHSKLAYTEEELRDVFKCGRAEASSEAFFNALLFLTDLGSLDERWVGGAPYYGYRREIEELP